MIKIQDNAVIGAGAWNGAASNPYPAMKPWVDAQSGAAWYVIDNETGEPFTDDDGKVYKLRKRSLAELVNSASYDAVKVEQSRLQTAFDSLTTTGILTLDNKGAGEVTHNLNSKWYAVSVTPLDAAMPDIYVKCQKNAFEVKGGSANSRVMYALSLVAPPKGRENQILTNPY